MNKEKTFKLVTLGCRTNQYELQGFRDQLEALGYQEAESGDQAALCVVNTCTVTANADKDSRYEVRKLHQQYPDAEILVTGCAAELDPDGFVALGGVKHVVPNKEKEKLLARIFDTESLPEFSIRHFDAHTRAFIKVQDGCNSFCTYCIIPYVRGRSRSRPLPEIIKEVEELVKNGYQEVVLTGINIGDFDGAGEEGVKLHHLVRAVDQVEGLKRLRVSSIDPDEVDDDLMDAILNGKNTCPSMHIVLQSGSNVILKRMNRKYTRQIFWKTVENLKKYPDFTFTTDVIVGFPGETEEDFQETLDVVGEVQFAKVHVFPYSERKRTRAASFTNKVSHEVIQERKQRLIRLSEKVAFDLREKFIGRQLEILTEESSEGEVRGHSTHFIPVIVPGVSIKPNQLIQVKCISNSPKGLIGQLCG